MKKIEATPAELAAAFTEWERRYRENPEKFASDQERLAGTPESYGDSCTPYFISILEEQKK